MKRQSVVYSVFMKSLCFTVFLSLVALLSGCTQTQAMQTYTDPRQIDVAFVYEQLQEVHPAFQKAKGKAFVDAAYEKLLAKAPSMDDPSFFFALKAFSSLGADSHTGIVMTPQVVSQLHAVPLQLQYLQGAWRLSVVEQQHQDLLGATVVSVNGIPLDEVVTRASSLVAADNLVWLRHSLAGMFNITELYTYLGLATGPLEPVSFTVVRLGETQAQEFRVEPVSAQSFQGFAWATLYQNPCKTGPSSSYYRAFLINEGKTLFMQYNVCASSEDYPIDTFTKEVLAQLPGLHIQQVIIDLRYNGGGDSRLFEPMMDGLSKLQKQLGFTLDVLIGEGTFSSALMNAIQLTQRTECTLVGTPSGGSVNHYGEVKQFTLPNSHLPLFISSKRFTMDADYPSDSLQPDMLVEPTIEDMLAGIDTTVEATLQ